MATVNSGIREDANFLNLKEIAQKQVKSEVNNNSFVSKNHLITYCLKALNNVFTCNQHIVNFRLISDQKQTSKEFVQIYSSIFYKIDF